MLSVCMSRFQKKKTIASIHAAIWTSRLQGNYLRLGSISRSFGLRRTFFSLMETATTSLSILNNPHAEIKSIVALQVQRL